MVNFGFHNHNGLLLVVDCLRQLGNCRAQPGFVGFQRRNVGFKLFDVRFTLICKRRDML